MKYLLTGLLALSALYVCANDDRTSHNENTVGRYLAAFNAQDVSLMLEMVTEDIQWLSVSGGNLVIEVEGAQALGEAMSDYFRQCSSCRATIQDFVSTGNRVSVVEEASWKAVEGRRSQRALAVYAFSGSLIQRVYYFSEEF